METKELKIAKLVDDVKTLGEEIVDDTNGFLLLAYEKADNKLASTFLSRGNFMSLIECLYANMKSDPMLSNVIMTASSLIAQDKLMEAQVQAAETEATKETVKPKRNRKKITN